MLQMIQIWNSGEHERFLDELGPDLVFSPDPSFPDAGTYSGEEFRRWMRDWISTWEENRFEMLEVTELEQALLVEGRWHLATRGSGDEVPLADFTVVVVFPDEVAERPHRMAVFFDRGRAIELAKGGTG
jgi:SnoaL-like domain